jgi:hypothetical protein
MYNCIKSGLLNSKMKNEVEKFDRMSSLLESLEEILYMEDKIHIITDLAFEAIDEDGSG